MRSGRLEGFLRCRQDYLPSAAPSQTSVTSACRLRSEAGQAVVSPPASIVATASRLAAPFAIIRIFFARRMVPIPIVNARVGTSASEAKKRAFALMVEGVRSVTCVATHSVSAGSLKPVYPPDRPMQGSPHSGGTPHPGRSQHRPARRCGTDPRSHD